MRVIEAKLYRADQPDASPIERYDCFEFPHLVDLVLKGRLEDVAEERVLYIRAASPRMGEVSDWLLIEERDSGGAWNDFEFAFEAPWPGPYGISIVSNNETLVEIPLQVGSSSESVTGANP